MQQKSFRWQTSFKSQNPSPIAMFSINLRQQKHGSQYSVNLKKKKKKKEKTTYQIAKILN